MAHVQALQAVRKKVVIALWSEGSRDRMASMLRDHKLVNVTSVNSWRMVQATPRNETMLAVLGMEPGFETDHVAVISEQDILGDRLVRPRKATRKLDNFISEVTSLAAGDLVVHVEHGIGRFVGLQTLEVSGAPHDCLELHYAAETKLFLPVENIELLSRYGSDQANVELDRLGGTGWQTAQGQAQEPHPRDRGRTDQDRRRAACCTRRRRLPVQAGIYDEFCARFPYDETEDQLTAIQATLKDLESGRPMDRLICGDVGFGKTEVALRAAFAVALDGKQVAVVVPTTLLARQHAKDLHRTLQGFSGQCRAGLAAGRRQGAQPGQEGAGRRLDRYRRRHPCAARQGDQVQGSRPAHRRRGAAFRRQPQGAAEAAARRGACADA